jgi:hypothetical protein
MIGFNKGGIPIFKGQDIDPKTITDKLYIGAHISWENSRCAGDNYGLFSYPGSGVIFDIGPVHMFVMTDHKKQTGCSEMHFVPSQYCKIQSRSSRNAIS